MIITSGVGRVAERANWKWDGAIEYLTLNYRIGRALAEGSDWPNWYKAAEFRATRDKSRAGK